jgi:hypothetical protein
VVEIASSSTIANEIIEHHKMHNPKNILFCAIETCCCKLMSTLFMKHGSSNRFTKPKVFSYGELCTLPATHSFAQQWLCVGGWMPSDLLASSYYDTPDYKSSFDRVHCATILNCAASYWKLLVNVIDDLLLAFESEAYQNVSCNKKITSWTCSLRYLIMKEIRILENNWSDTIDRLKEYSKFNGKHDTENLIFVLEP